MSRTTEGTQHPMIDGKPILCGEVVTGHTHIGNLVRGPVVEVRIDGTVFIDGRSYGLSSSLLIAGPFSRRWS